MVVQKSTLFPWQSWHAKLARYSCSLGLGSAVAESPAAIKLLAGCVQQLRQAAQPQPQPLDMQQAPKCICNICQLLQSFLAHPDQVQILPLGGHAEAEHGIR